MDYLFWCGRLAFVYFYILFWCNQHHYHRIYRCTVEKLFNLPPVIIKICVCVCLNIECMHKCVSVEWLQSYIQHSSIKLNCINYGVISSKLSQTKNTWKAYEWHRNNQNRLHKNIFKRNFFPFCYPKINILFTWTNTNSSYEMLCKNALSAPLLSLPL